MAVYALLLGKPLTRVFSPVTRPAKLANGRRSFESLCTVVKRLGVPKNEYALRAWLERLHLEIVVVPSAKSGSGTRLSYQYLAQFQPLLEAAAEVTEQALEAAYTLQKGAAK